MGFYGQDSEFMRVFFGKVMQGLTKESKRCILNKRLRKRFYALVKDFSMASLQKSLEESTRRWMDK
jgi:hypothetical protein